MRYFHASFTVYYMSTTVYKLLILSLFSPLFLRADIVRAFVCFVPRVFQRSRAEEVGGGGHKVAARHTGEG